MKEKYLYQDSLVDKEPLEVKVIQRHKSLAEITRNLEGNAGFWVEEKQLIKAGK